MICKKNKPKKVEDLLLEQLQAGLRQGLTPEDLQEFEYVKAMCMFNIVIETLVKHKLLKEKDLMKEVVKRVKVMYNANAKIEGLLKKSKKGTNIVSYIG